MKVDYFINSPNKLDSMELKALFKISLLQLESIHV